MIECNLFYPLLNETANSALLPLHFYKIPPITNSVKKKAAIILPHSFFYLVYMSFIGASNPYFLACIGSSYFFNSFALKTLKIFPPKILSISFSLYPFSINAFVIKGYAVTSFNCLAGKMVPSKSEPIPT